jgi:valyl-tRNA synthetase
LIIAKFPIADEGLIDHQIDSAMSFIQETIVGIRNLRKQLNISPAVNVDIHIRIAKSLETGAGSSSEQIIDDYRGYICKLAKVGEITMGVDIAKPASSMIAVVQDIQIYLPLVGLIDVEAEKAKLTKQKEKLEQELAGIQNKLQNEKFVANAKPEVIEKEKEKEIEVGTKLKTVVEVIESFG